jgi:hypothetical protein
LKNAWATRDDGIINFTWGVKPPFARNITAERTELQVELTAGNWRAEWHDTKTGQVAKSESFTHAGGVRALAAPAYTEDIALRISQ